MSAWIVYSKDGQTERCKLKKLEYSGSFMNERSVTATFEYHSEVAFEVFDYIVYRGEKFELEAIPSVKKISSMDYQYELRFVSLKYELERCEMRDIVPNDNGITYPTPLTFSFTGDVRYLTERIQANLDALYGQGVWSIVVSDDVESEEKNITIAQQNCWNALSLVNTTYGLNFSIKGRVVTVGGNQPSVGHTFQYGKGNGLYEIERNSDTDTGIVTKLRAYGSTRNLDYSYPKKPEWTDSVLPVSFILSPLRLMLPSFKEDGKTDYILADEATISEYGIREASVIYDDIYPSITGATNSSGVPIDEIKSVEPIDDSASTFVVYLHDLEFDLESHLTTDNAQISMKSGAMQGYTFNISEIERISNNFYKITLGRITTAESDTGNYDIPNSSWHMEAGDKFVFLNILMPQKYIRDAEERLLKRAQEYLAEYGKTNFSYNVGLHDKFLKEHEAVYNELIEGAKLSVYDSELGISENVTVQSITITEYADDNILPQVKVTLNNKPSASTLERIQGQIKELSETSAGQFSTQSELLKQYRRKLDKPFFDRLFAAVDFDGNEIPSTDMTTPIAYIKARFNFATLGGVTMYLDDKSLNLPSIYDGLPIDGNTIYWENGILKAKGGGGGIESITKQMVIEALGFTPYSAENPNGYITAASIPSALKNPYALTFGSKTYDGSSAKEITASDLGAALSSDLSKYLPLSGGTINSSAEHPLDINSTSAATRSFMVFRHNSSAKSYFGYTVANGAFIENAEVGGILKITSDGLLFNTGKVWHAGNDGSGSGLDADKLDGKHISEISKYIFTNGTAYALAADSDLDTVGCGYYTSNDNIVYPHAPVTNFGLLTVNLNGDYKGQIVFPYGSNYEHIRFRSQVYENGIIWKGWRKLAYIDDNVASATKLKTARTIWGQSFDGTGNVTGNINLPNSSKIFIKDASNNDICVTQIYSNDLHFGNGANSKGYDTYIGGNRIIMRYGTSSTWGFVLSETGNVGIGTTNPAYKLDISHSIGDMIRLNSTGSTYSCIIYQPNEGNSWSVGANKNNQFYFYHNGATRAYIDSNGNILATGGVTMQSQRSLKNVVDERGLSLTELSVIKPTRYTWKDKRDDRIHFGGIADDIENVLPEVIYTTADGTLTMDYGNAGFAIASSLIKPVVDHEERIKVLERENEMLKQELNRLRA